MAKQTFTTGQVLTAAQMTSLQQTAMLGGAASAKTASYTLVAADAGTAISMSSASATTITVNTALFAAGDTVHITNIWRAYQHIAKQLENHVHDIRASHRRIYPK